MSKELATTSKQIVKADQWYGALVEECQAIFTERSFEQRWSKIQMMHELGQVIREASQGHEVSITKLVKELALDMNTHERNLWYAVQFYDHHPDLDALPDGKATSWTKLRQDLPIHKVREAKSFDYHAEVNKIIDRFGVDGARKLCTMLDEALDQYETDK